MSLRGDNMNECQNYLHFEDDIENGKYIVEWLFYQRGITCFRAITMDKIEINMPFVRYVYNPYLLHDKEKCLPIPYVELTSEQKEIIDKQCKDEFELRHGSKINWS